MKKSELKQIIREEIGKSQEIENKTYNRADLENILYNFYGEVLSGFVMPPQMPDKKDRIKKVQKFLKDKNI